MRWLALLLATGVALSCGAMLLSGISPWVWLVHGALMLVAWGVLMPLGAVLARYYKVMPGQRFPEEVENLFWWDWHRRLQIIGITLATVALALILAASGGRFDDSWHSRCGLLVMVLGWLQGLTPLARGSKGGPTGAMADPGDPSTWRGDHFDMTPRRRAFERWHKPVGWLVLLLAAGTILLGLELTGAPDWLVAVVGLLQAATLCGLLDGAVRGRWVDTYASLWNAGPHHPDPARRTPPAGLAQPGLIESETAPAGDSAASRNALRTTPAPGPGSQGYR